jgi:aspartate racemase
MQHIGIVACSFEGAGLCYRAVCLESEPLLGKYAHPQITLHNHSLGEYQPHIAAGEWEQVGALMLDSAQRLARAGADFLICPDNTIHEAMPFVAPHSPLPWLHIAAVVADQAVARGFRRIGILGTRWLVLSDVYPEQLEKRGLAWLRPTDEEREEINRIIMEELVRGIVRPEAVAYHQQVMARMKDAGCDAVVLGCTEIPIIMSDANSPLPTLDSTRLLACAALRRATARSPNMIAESPEAR